MIYYPGMIVWYVALYAVIIWMLIKMSHKLPEAFQLVLVPGKEQNYSIA